MDYKIVMTPDKEYAEEMRDALKDNSGHCPCKIIKNKDTKCLCKEFREQDINTWCECGLYFKEGILGD